MYLSVIIPAYNEEDRIEKTLHAVDGFLRGKNFDYEIIVVNDGSQDRTAEVVTLLGQSMPHLLLLNNTKNQGKGSVVRQGMLHAQGECRLFMDADSSTSIEYVDSLLPYVTEGFDIVIGSRRAEGSKIEIPQPPIREFLGAVFRLLMHIIVPLKIKDSQNGFKLFTAKAVEDIFKRQRTHTWAFDVELLAIAKILGYKVKEVGIRWANDDRSKITVGGMFMMLIELLEIRVNIWRHLYGKVIR